MSWMVRHSHCIADAVFLAVSQQIEVPLRCCGCLDIKLRQMRRTRQDLLTFGECEQGLAEQVTASAQVLIGF